MKLVEWPSIYYLITRLFRVKPKVRLYSVNHTSEPRYSTTQCYINMPTVYPLLQQTVIAHGYTILALGRGREGGSITIPSYKVTRQKFVSRVVARSVVVSFDVDVDEVNSSPAFPCPTYAYMIWAQGEGSGRGVHFSKSKSDAPKVVLLIVFDVLLMCWWRWSVVRRKSHSGIE